MSKEEASPLTLKEKEAFYDSEIAPVLADLAKKCKDKGMDFAAVVFNDVASYRTLLMKRDSAAKRQVCYAIFADGNADVLIGRMLQDGAENGHNSFYLHLLEQS